MLALYFNVIGILIIFIASFGFIGPYLISAASDFTVGAGIVYLIVVIPLLYKMCSFVIRQGQSLINQNKEEVCKK